MNSYRIECKYCGSEDIVKAGTRKTKKSAKQLYRCNDCMRRFSNSFKAGKRTDPRAVLKALVLYCQGYTYDDIRYILRKKLNVERTKAALCNWVKEYDPPYLKLRDRNPGDRRIVKSWLFTHNKLNYMYQLHTVKLKFAKRHPDLINYLLKLPDFLDHSIFERAQHCSQFKILGNPGLRHWRGTQLNHLTAQAVQLASSNRARHQTVEDYLLSCDRNTIAVEVPVYIYDKRIGSIAGHIDALQVYPDRLRILDYKPNAAKENPEKVVTQLTLYANALALRSRTPLRNFSCAYFDENDGFEFRPRRLDQVELASDISEGKGNMELFQRENLDIEAKARGSVVGKRGGAQAKSKSGPGS